jgi:Mn-containing catalase
MLTFEDFRDKRREYAFTKSVSSSPKDQDTARKIRTQMDYDDLKKQIGSKKKPQIPANAVVESDAAFEFVKNKIRKEVGKSGYVSKDNPRKPQSAADKAKVRAHQSKVDAENAAERKKDPSQGRYP